MATIVPTSEEDPCLAVVRYASELAWADAGPEVSGQQVARLLMEAQECMVMERWFDLASLMLTSANLLVSNLKITEKDLECVFTVICSLVIKPQSLDEVHDIAKLVCAKITQHPTDRPTLRLKILFNLYNLLENPYSRFFVYLNILQFSVNGKITEHIIPHFKKIDTYLKEWAVEVRDQRELFRSIYNVLAENRSNPEEYYKFLTRYLATFSGEDVHAMVDAKEEASRAIVEFIKARDIFQCDLLDMPAVRQLELDPKHGLLYQLLKIFLTRRLDSYLEFHASNSALLKTYGLSHEDCITKMRLMSLVDLASTENSPVQYAAITDALQINKDEVEQWVVKAIAAKLIKCKIDQLNEVIHISSSTERIFDQQQWLALRSKLASWRGNVAGVLNLIRSNKIVEDSTHPPDTLTIG